MWNIPTKARLETLPMLRTTDHIPLKDTLIYLHFFIGGCDWWAAEYDGEDLLWGFVILSDHDYAEWGYFSLDELKSIKIQGWLEVDCEAEENWTVKKASEIKGIKIY
jgi:hypothetical protein